MISNNDILRRLRFAFDLNDDTMMRTFALADTPATRAEISAWLKRDEDPDFVGMSDRQLATFLNGFINLKRGKREGEQPEPENRLNNNLILRKLRIALNLTDDDLVAILDLADMKVSKAELGAFFRNPKQPQYRPCKDQILRYFLKGLQLKYRSDV